MKKMTKALLVTALCFAITGAAFCIVSICTGFTVEEFQKAVSDSDFVRIGSSDVTQEMSGFVSDLFADTTDFSQSYRDVESLKLQMGAADCRIIVWEKDEWQVKGYHMPDSFSVKKEGDWLKINGTRSGIKFWKVRDDTVLELYIPESVVLKQVKLEAGVGEIHVEDGMLVCEELELECGVGACDISADVRREASIEGGVGEVRLLLAGAEADYDYDIECGLGSVTLGKTGFDGPGVDRRIDNDADREIRLECGIGSVEIQFTRS